MKLFLTILEFYQIMGIFLPKSGEKCSFNWKNVFFMYISTQSIVPITAFLLFQPSKTVYECGISIYVIISGLVFLLYFLIQMWQMSDILSAIETYEVFIEKSKQLTE